MLLKRLLMLKLRKASKLMSRRLLLLLPLKMPKMRTESVWLRLNARAKRFRTATSTRRCVKLSVLSYNLRRTSSRVKSVR